MFLLPSLAVLYCVNSKCDTKIRTTIALIDPPFEDTARMGGVQKGGKSLEACRFLRGFGERVSAAETSVFMLYCEHNISHW